MAHANGMVIGNNLYQLTKGSLGDDYHFNKIEEYPIDDNSNNLYSVYSIMSRDKGSNDKKKKLYKNILWNIILYFYEI